MPLALNRRDALLALCGGACAAAVPARQPSETQDDPFTGFPGTQVRFAGTEAGRSLLAAHDEWTAATGGFQRQAVMGRGQPPLLEEFIRWNGDAARPWSGAQRARWRRALEALAPAFTALRVPLPGTVHLVATNGQESANAPYTRANAVMLPGPAPMPSGGDVQLLAHEFWHVASRHSPATASRLYAEIGFQPMPRLRFPPQWQPLRIANPDAPNHEHAMRLNVAGGGRPWVTPVLVASRTALRPGETFFDVMEVRLLEVLPGESPDGASAAVTRGGEPVWHRLHGDHDYLRQLGGNTGYVIHPEEVIADNIGLLAAGGRARNPALLERLGAALRAA